MGVTIIIMNSSYILIIYSLTAHKSPYTDSFNVTGLVSTSKRSIGK